MPEFDEYHIANLTEEQVKEIQAMEAKIRKDTGEPITLIAYANDRQHSDLGCRAGLDD